MDSSSDEHSNDKPSKSLQGNLLPHEGRVSFASITTWCKIPIGLLTTYIPAWKSSDGLREYFQNMRDGVLARFGRESFELEKLEKPNDILIRNFSEDRKSLLSWVRYTDGVIEFVNRRATLSHSDIAVGGTSKRGKDGLSGEHGEGFANAALTFLREGYGVNVYFSGFRLSFPLTDRGEYLEMNGRLQRLTEKTLAKNSSELAKSTLDDPRANYSKDIRIVIGAKGDINGLNGVQRKGRRVPEPVFRAFMDRTLDINIPTSEHQTDDGELLLNDPGHAGRLYIRGLFVGESPIAGFQLIHGASINNLHLNRDRQATDILGAVPTILLNLWASAIMSKVNGAVATYSELLIEKMNDVLDVMLNRCSHYPSKNMMVEVWKYMRGRGTGDLFYYEDTGSSDDVHIITSILHKKPAPLKTPLWKLFRRYRLNRTPVEEQQLLFSKARVVPIPDTLFARHVHWMLRSLLQAHKSTEQMDVEYVEEAGLGIDILLDNRTWKVNQRWLAHPTAHEDEYHGHCKEAEPSEDRPFACDHVIKKLLDGMVAHSRASNSKSGMDKCADVLKGFADFELIQMPRKVSCAPTDRRGELVVAWQSVDPYRNKDKLVKVVLHVQDCALFPEAAIRDCMKWPTQQCTVSCQCPVQVGLSGASSITFVDLDPTKEYHACASVDADGAFIGIVPEPAKARNEDTRMSVDRALDPEEFELGQSQNNRNSASPRTGRRASNNILTGGILDSAPNPDFDLASDQAAASDIDSLYADPPQANRSGPRCGDDPTVFSLFSSPAPMSGPVRAADDHAGDMPPPRGTYVQGARVDHNKLKWGEGFPGSHDIFHTRDNPAFGVYIFIPKPGWLDLVLQFEKERNKRQAGSPSLRRGAKKQRLTEAGESSVQPQAPATARLAVDRGSAASSATVGRTPSP